MAAEGENAREGSILDIPTIEPFQFDSPGLGSLEKTVNLFRGDVNFKIPLVSLTGRNGLDVEVAALYRSDVEDSASHWNRSHPTGVLGLGWEMPVDRIVAYGDGSATREGNDYYFVRDGGLNRLFRTTRRWARGEIDSALSSSLDSERTELQLLQALLDQGLAVDPGAKVEALEKGSSWRLVDPVNERTLTVDRGDHSLVVFDGGLSYEAQSFDFSRIRYYPEFERWEITYANAITSVFGGTGGDAVEWGVRWGNWTGASGLTHVPATPSSPAQQQYATAWNLAGAYTLWGDTVSFEYEQVQQPVGAGGLPYTKACYLSRIIDVFGRTVSFEYGPKEFVPGGDDGAREYFDPNKSVPDDLPDAYQSRYETRFLQAVEVKAEDGEPLQSLDFEYRLATYATLGASDPPSLRGDTMKRAPVRIVKTLPNGDSLPPLEFTYYSGADIHPGALQTMTYPEGGTASYVYEHTELSACDRAMEIHAPFVGGTPRAWFGADYAVVAWYDGQGKLELSVYTWIGRWRKWQPVTPVFNQAVDMGDIDVELAEDFFVLHYGAANDSSSTIRAFHKDERVLGSWTAASFNPLVLETVDRELTTGNDFFAVCDRYHRTVTAYAWDPLSDAWDKEAVPTTCDPAVAETRLYVTGAGRALGVLCYDLTGPPGAKRNKLLLQTLDELGQWRRGEPVPAPEIHMTDPKAGGFYWSATSWAFVAGCVTEELDSALRHRVLLYTWDTEQGLPYRLLPPAVFDYELKKTEKGRVTQPFQPIVTATGLVAAGPNLLRYNGVDWLPNDSLEALEPVTDETVFWFAPGPDYVVKTENSPNRALGAVLVYDPNTDVNSWSADRITLFDDPPTEQRLRRYFPTAATDFLSWDLRVYTRGSASNWTGPLESEPLLRLPSGVDTTTVIDEGPDFLAYLVTEGDKNSVVGTQVLAIRNGRVKALEEIPERMFQVVRADGSFESETTGKLPAAPSAFLSYLPLNVELDKAETIVLRRFLDESAQAPIVDRPAVAVEFDDGFQTVTHRFAFDSSTAACDASGRVAKYYRSEVWVGGPERPNGWTRYSFVNGIGQVGSEGPGSPSLVDGLPAAKTIYDSGGKEIGGSSTSWQVETAIVDLTSGAKTPIRGAYVEAVETTRTEDGISLTTSYTYDLASGQRISEESTALNAAQEPEIRVASTRYGFQAYPALARANDLTAVVQQKATAKVGEAAPVVTSCSAVSWRGFERSSGSGPLTVWAEAAQWAWLGGEGSGDFPFTLQQEWGAPAGWSETSRVISRSAHGLELEREAPPGKASSKIYDALEGSAVASFTLSGAAAGEAYYYGFESYEQAGPWALDLATTPIVDDTSNCGRRSLAIPAGAATTPLRLTPPGGARHLFSFWVRTAAGPDASVSAGWQLKVGGQPETTIPVQAGEDWRYCAKLIDLTASEGPVPIELTTFNSGAEAIYVDDVAFASYEGQFVASVYDEPFLRPIADVGPYNSLTRRAYDGLGRPIARTDAGQGVIEATVPYLAGQDELPPTPSSPNRTITLQPRGQTLYERFADGDGWKSRWHSEAPDQWSAAGGRLLHTASATGSIELVDPPLAPPFFLSVEVEAQGPVTAETGLSLGSTTIGWDPATKHWRLRDGSGGSAEAPFESGSPEGRWVLAVTDAALLFLVDGRVAFATLPASLPAGAPQVFAGSEISFTEVVAGGDPLIGASFFDGATRPRQGHSLESAETTLTATIYDDLGRPAVKTKPATLAPTATQPLLSYRQDFVTGLDWSSGTMSGALADALPEDEGYPYSRTRFEDSPLSRAVEAGSPGKELAITASPPQQRRTAKASFGCNVEGGFPADMKLPGGQYRLATKIDPDGIEAVTVSDKWGQRIAEGLLLDPAAGDYLTTSYLHEYLPAAQVATVRLPNYHAPPDPAHRDAWVRQTTYDLRGRTIQVETPDAGKADYIYDQSGNLRFYQDTAGVAVGTVTYRRYDTVDRPVEVGTLAMAWAPGLFQQKAEEDPGWPTVADGAKPNRLYRYDGDGEDVREMGVLSDAVAEGEGEQSAVVSIRHDERSRVAATLESVTGGETRETAYTYDNLGHPLATTYPSGTVLTAERDTAGRVATVKQDDEVLASYQYDAGDRVVQETMHPGTPVEIATKYAYSSPGWLESIESPLVKQYLSYTSGGYEGAAYYNGRIARQEVDLTIPEPGSFATSLSYEYAYDHSGRLLTARALAGAEPRPDLSLGLESPISYDANGNFLGVPTGSGSDLYRYLPGSDFATGTTDGEQQYQAGPEGNAVTALPHGVSSITYDPISRLPLTLATQGNGLIAFEYGPGGRRATKRTEHGTRIYSRGLGGPALAEEYIPTTGEPTTTEYLYGPTGLLAIREQGGTRVVLHDHLRSPRALLDESGAVLAAYQYLPFGSFAGPTYGEADALRFGFGGYERDLETGLYNALSRLYDPELRRFLGVDPKLQFASPYVYGGNNPLSMVDPDGRSAWWAILLGAVTGALLTVLTGGAAGAGAAALLGVSIAGETAADIVAASVVGAVAGVTGSIAGDAVTAAASHEAFTGQRALTDALSGLAGGAVGAGVGGLAARGAINLTEQLGLQAVKVAGTAAALLAGGATGALASMGAASAVTGRSPFSGGSAVDMMVGAIAGFGASLLASGAYLAYMGVMPRALTAEEFALVDWRPTEGEGLAHGMLTFVDDASYNQTEQAVVNRYGSRNAIFRVRDTASGFNGNTDVIALHGAGRFVLPLTIRGYMQPMSAEVFGQYLQHLIPEWVAPLAPNIPIKLSICFAAQPFGMDSSVAASISRALGRTVFAGRGLVYPHSSADPMAWERFG